LFIDQDPSSIPIVCFDKSHSSAIKLERGARISIAPLDQNSEPSLSLQQLLSAITNAKFPKKWGKVDRSMVYYRTGTWKEAPHFGLTDDNAFKLFLEDWSNRREGNEVQLVVYTKQRSTTPGKLSFDHFFYICF
jgi:hypothetical protein